ncbi:MAG: hypothetical protein WD847_07285 [Pirellulales bacterium]
MAEQQRQLWWWVARFVSILLIGFIFVAPRFREGIQVTVQNTGATPIHSVMLHVTGESYSLGDLASGASGYATVSPSGESHLEIEFTDADGNRQRLNAGGYFERGYGGTIRLSIEEGAIEENEHHVTIY